MHIDWFIVFVFSFTIPLAWWTTWLALKDRDTDRKRDAIGRAKDSPSH
jgi:hypothetical protein